MSWPAVSGLPAFGSTSLSRTALVSAPPILASLTLATQSAGVVVVSSWLSSAIRCDGTSIARPSWRRVASRVCHSSVRPSLVTGGPACVNTVAPPRGVSSSRDGRRRSVTVLNRVVASVSVVFWTVSSATGGASSLPSRAPARRSRSATTAARVIEVASVLPVARSVALVLPLSSAAAGSPATGAGSGDASATRPSTTRFSDGSAARMPSTVNGIGGVVLSTRNTKMLLRPNAGTSPLSCVVGAGSSTCCGGRCTTR
jgi:hypothetical protein